MTCDNDINSLLDHYKLILSKIKMESRNRREEIGNNQNEILNRLKEMEKSTDSFTTEVDSNYEKYEKFEKNYDNYKVETTVEKHKREDQRRIMYSEYGNEMIVSYDELCQIADWSETSLHSLLFDSQKNNWFEKESDFDVVIFGREKLIFVIEDTENNVFGCYIDAIVDKYNYKENNEWKGSEIADPNAFIFSLKSNGRVKDPIKFDINPQSQNSAFRLFKPDFGLLFAVGRCDIAIGKQNFKNNCYCKQESYDYGIHKNVLVGKDENHVFSVKRFQVFQMEETAEQKEAKERNRKLREEEKQQNEIRKFEIEKNKMKEYKATHSEEFNSAQVKQIEKWSGLTFRDYIFDSNYCDWKQYSSTFDKHIFNNEKLAFIIETKTGIKYGGFLYAPVNKYRTQNQNGQTEGIVDQKSFLFTFKDNKPVKVDLKRNMKDKTAFYLYKENDDRLFVFGSECDIWIGKKGFQAACNQSERSMFDFPKRKKVLTGIIGSSQQDKFDVKRIQVLSFK